MLIKLSCGYEINPERVTLEVRGIHCFAHIDSLTLPLKSDEEVEIRAYHTKTVVVDGFADGRYEEPQTRKTKPFSVQDIPRNAPSPEQIRIEKLMNMYFDTLSKTCVKCAHQHTSECDSCLNVKDHAVELKKFSPKDCSGAQHEKQVVRSCQSCAHLSRPVCLSCSLEDSLPHWTPRA